MSLNNVSVVLVHGAWADGSSWSKVIGPLRAEGVRLVAAPLPLTSLADDVAALDWTLERIKGPVVAGRTCLCRGSDCRHPRRESQIAGLRRSPRSRRRGNGGRRVLSRGAASAGAHARSRPTGMARSGFRKQRLPRLSLNMLPPPNI
jgi:hypothetical protein